MADHYLRKYGVATTIDFSLYKLDGTGLKVDAVSATHDIKIMKDEGAEADTTADAFVDEGQGYSLALTATEMTAARVVIYIVDLSSPQVWLDKQLIIETYGNASAQHAFDLASATVNLSSTSEGQIDTIDTNAAAIKAKTDLIGASVALESAGNLAAVKAKTDLIGASVALESSGNLAAVLAESQSHPTLAEIEATTVLAKEATFTHATYGIDKIKTETAAIKAKTDLLTLAAIADAIWDEVNSGHVTAGTVGLALQNLLKIGKNKWSYAGTTFTIYDDNGTTPLYVFTLDSATPPITSRTPI